MGVDRLISTIQHSVSFSTVSLSRIARGSFPTLPLRFEEQCEIRGLLHVVCGKMLPHVEKLNSTNESETLHYITVFKFVS